MASGLPEQRIVGLLQARLPGLLGIWLFGSHASGHAGAGSDIDLAVLVPGKADVLALWHTGQELAAALDHDVDLLDLRAASTVMQYQVITTGRRLWQKDPSAALYECAILSDKTELDTARAGLLADIAREGRIYGRSDA